MDSHERAVVFTSRAMPHAKRIAEASASEVKIAPELLVPIIVNVLSVILPCLEELKTSPRAAARKARAGDRENRDLTQLARQYWNRSRRTLTNAALTWDQSLVLARHTIEATHDVPDAELSGLTESAVELAKAGPVVGSGEPVGDGEAEDVDAATDADGE